MLLWHTWSGKIDFQPIVVQTDHMALEHCRGFIEWGGDPELSSVIPMGTTMDTTGSTIGGGFTPELLSMSHDGLPLVLPTARGMTFLTMGLGRTHILDRDGKNSYL